MGSLVATHTHTPTPTPSHTPNPAFAHVGVVGGAGGMGRWLAEFLRTSGYHVEVADPALPNAPEAADLAGRVDALFIAVPIGATIDVIAKVGPHVRAGAALLDVTSLKEREVAAMLAATAQTGAEVVGTHPLFGPSATDVVGKNIITCAGRGASALEWIESVYRDAGAVVTRASAAQHDEMMAIVQGLEHFSTVATGLALRDLGVPVELFGPYATPSFDFKVGAIRRVFCDSPRLYGEIMGTNPRNAAVVERYLEVASEMAHAVRAGDSDALTALIEGGAPYYCRGGSTE